MSPDFRSLPLGFPEFWRIQLPQNPSRQPPKWPGLTVASNTPPVHCHVSKGQSLVTKIIATTLPSIKSYIGTGSNCWPDVLVLPKT